MREYATRLKSPNPDLRSPRVPYNHATSRNRPVFFFQAEDGIRGGTVTGVQTCALPILAEASQRSGLRSKQASDITKRRGEKSGGVRRDRKSVVEGKSVDLGGRRII